MKRRIKLFPVLVLAFAIVACGLVTMNRLDGDIAVLEDTARETQRRKLDAEAKRSALQQEIAVKDTDSYIMEKARSLYGYLMPGEIRFVVVNPDSLYDTPEAVVVAQETAAPQEEATP